LGPRYASARKQQRDKKRLSTQKNIGSSLFRMGSVVLTINYKPDKWSGPVSITFGILNKSG
jgi:hypothetical protein